MIVYASCSNMLPQVAYGKSAGILDRPIQCDLNKWTDAQKREIGEIVAEQVPRSRRDTPLRQQPSWSDSASPWR